MQKENHPSYGMISVSKVNSNGTVLFGSRIKHEHYIKLEIYTAEKQKNEYSEYYFPRDLLISIDLSSVQFANLLVESNTVGVPCTLDFVVDQGRIDREEDLKPIKKELEEDVKINIEKLKEKTRKLSKIIQHDFKGQIKKAKKEEIRDLVIQIENGINSNLDFLFSQHIKKLESVGSEIISEAEARISSMVQSTGIKTLRETSSDGNIQTLKKISQDIDNEK